MYFILWIVFSTMFKLLFSGQRITTIQLDGTQYYISRMNPYSAELNYFLAYEYCRSIGLQLASFETLEKTNSISDFLRNAGNNYFFIVLNETPSNLGRAWVDKLIIIDNQLINTTYKNTYQTYVNK